LVRTCRGMNQNQTLGAQFPLQALRAIAAASLSGPPATPACPGKASIQSCDSFDELRPDSTECYRVFQRYLLGPALLGSVVILTFGLTLRGRVELCNSPNNCVDWLRWKGLSECGPKPLRFKKPDSDDRGAHGLLHPGWKFCTVTAVYRARDADAASAQRLPWPNVLDPR